MKKTLKELIYDNFRSTADCARKLGVTRGTVYAFVAKNKLTDRMKVRVELAGFSPHTFKPLKK